MLLQQHVATARHLCEHSYLLLLKNILVYRLYVSTCLDPCCALCRSLTGVVTTRGGQMMRMRQRHTWPRGTWYTCAMIGPHTILYAGDGSPYYKCLVWQPCLRLHGKTKQSLAEMVAARGC
jgi:hypothetical protein